MTILADLLERRLSSAYPAWVPPPGCVPAHCFYEGMCLQGCEIERKRAVTTEPADVIKNGGAA